MSFPKKSMKILPLTVCAVISLSLCQRTLADTVVSTWTGVTSTAWATTTNWSPNTVPTAARGALFNSAFTNQPVIAATTNVQGLWVTGATTTTGSSGLVTISGAQNLSINGSGTYNNLAAGILLDGAGNNSLTLAVSNVGLGNGISQTWIINNSGTLTVGTGSSPTAINGTTGTLTFAGNSASAKYILNARIISTSRAVVIDTAGSVTWNPNSDASANVYSGGLTLNNGTLNANVASVFGGGGTVNFNGTKLDNTSGSAITLTGSNVLALNSDLEFIGGGVGTAHDITINTSGTNSLVGANAAVVLNGSGTRTITTTASNSTLTIVDSIVSGSSSALRKAGAGKLTLSGSNTYAGKTTVSAGTLVLSGSGSINSSAGVNVASGATFDYSAKATGYTVNNMEGAGTYLGTTGQALTLAATGTLSAGDNGVGTLVVSAGDLSLISGAKFAMEIGGTTFSPSNDTVSLTGSGSIVTLAGSYTLLLSNVGSVAPDGLTFTLFDSVADIVSAGSWTIDYGTTGWSGGTVSLVGGNVVVSGLSAVPEPSTCILLGLGLTALVLRARRKATRA